jgi:hypothetical protein
LEERSVQVSAPEVGVCAVLVAMVVQLLEPLVHVVALLVAAHLEEHDGGPIHTAEQGAHGRDEERLVVAVGGAGIVPRGQDERALPDALWEKEHFECRRQDVSFEVLELLTESEGQWTCFESSANRIRGRPGATAAQHQLKH